MNSKVAFILGTIIGAGIGVIGTYSYFKDKYEKLAEEDFNSRRVFDEDKKEESVEPVVEKTADSRTVDKPSIAECAAILQREGYVNYSDMQNKKQKQEIAVDRPYVIQPSDFGEFDDYEKISLTYTADGVLLDDMNEIVLCVGRQLPNKGVTIVNAIDGPEAKDLFEKLITKKAVKK